MALFVRKFTFATRFCDALIAYFRLFLNSKPLKAVFSMFRCTLCALSDAAFPSSGHPCTAPALLQHHPQQKTAQTVLPNPSVLSLRTV